MDLSPGELLGNAVGESVHRGKVLSTGRPGRPEKKGDRRKRSSKRKKGNGLAPEISLADAIQQMAEGNTEQFMAKT